MNELRPSDCSEFDSRDDNALMAQPAISRRTFLSATAVIGALTFLGSVKTPFGNIISAYADEADNTHFSIYVLGRDEVPIMALREKDGKKVAVSGIKVNVKSLFNQKEASATTNDQGFATVHIRDLAFECENENATRYSFYGSVGATGDQCRDVYFPMSLIQSGVQAASDGTRSNVIEIPVETDDGTPYLRCVSLDDVDVLHSAAPAYVGEYNDIDHTFSVQVAVPSGATSVKVDLVVDKKAISSVAAKAMKGESLVWEANFTDKYLSTIGIGQTVKIRFRVDDGAARTAVLPLTFKRAVVLCENGCSSFTITPGSDPDGKKETRKSTSTMRWLFDKDDSFLASIPGCPVEFFSDATGAFGASVTLSSMPLKKSVDGQPVDIKRKFKLFGGNCGKSAWDSWKTDVVQKARSNYNAAVSDGDLNGTYLGTSGISKMFNAKIDIKAMAYGTNEFVSTDLSVTKTKGTADLAIAVGLAVDASFGSQFSVLGIPVYINGDFSLLVQGKAAIGMAFDNFFQNIKWGHHYTDGFAAQFVILINLNAGVSFGIGVMGIVSAAFRGYANGYIQFIFDRSQDKSVPRFITGAELGAQLVLQFLFFKKTFKLFDFVTFGPYDSWKDGSNALSSGTDAVALLSDENGEIDLSDAVMFSQEELSNVSEFKGEALLTSESDYLGELNFLEVADGVSTGMPYSYSRTKSIAGESLLLGSSDAWFIDPYADLDEDGELVSGATGTSDFEGFANGARASVVNTYNPHLGLVPTAQNILYSDVYSNTRLRAFVGNSGFNKSPEDNTIMARLVSTNVSVGDKTVSRTRVCIRPWDASQHAFRKEEIIEFNVDGLEASKRQDVDFHIDYMVYTTGPLLALIGITSIEVEDGVEYTPEEAQNKQFTSFVLWYCDAGWPLWAHSLYDKVKNDGIATYHPRVLIQGDPSSLKEFDQYRFCYYYFRKNVNDQTKNAIAVSSFTLSGLEIAKDLSIARQSDTPMPVQNESLLQGTFDVSTDYRTKLEDDGKNKLVHTVLTWHGTSSNSGFVRSFRFYDDKMVCDSQIMLSKVASVMRRGIEDTNNLFTYTQHLSVPTEMKNHVIKYDTQAKTLSDVETSSFSLDSHCFASHDGRRLYTVRVTEGAVPAVSNEVKEAIDNGAVVFSDSHYIESTGANYGGASLDGTEREPVYQLLESRWIDSLGAYHEFYPIARLSFPPDNISVLTYGQGSRDFVVSTITDIDEAKSDVYCVTVPDVVSIQCEGANADGIFATEGDTVGVFVSVCNIGNALVNGFTVRITDGSGKVIDERAYNDLREYLQPSMDNYHTVIDKSGNPTYNEDGSMKSEFVEDIRDTSGVLWPGFTRTYRFTFVMPAGYQGDTEFRVQLRDPISNPYACNYSTDDASLMSADADDASFGMPEHLSWLDVDEFSDSWYGGGEGRIVDPRKHPFTVSVNNAGGLIDGFSALPASYDDEDDSQPDDGSDSNGGGDSSDDVSGGDFSASSMAQTSDGLNPGVVAAGVAAAGIAGVVAAQASRKLSSEKLADDSELAFVDQESKGKA